MSTAACGTGSASMWQVLPPQQDWRCYCLIASVPSTSLRIGQRV
jgi:hypothetical protein